MSNLPFELDMDCFLNVVTSNSTEVSETFPIPLESNFILTHTLFHISLLNFAFNDDEFEEKPLTLKQGYLRFTFRFQSNSCILFLLLTPTLFDTLAAIQQSGYGTSEDVLFLVPVLSTGTENELLNSFNSDLIFQTEDASPFHADVLFYQPFNYRKIHCLFCPLKLNDINFDPKLFLTQLKSFSSILKSNGYGQTIVFPELLGATGKYKQDACLSPLRQKAKQNVRYSISINCSASEIYILGSLQPILNVTMEMNDNNVASDSQDWFLHIRQEGIILVVPNEYLKSRGSIIANEGHSFDALVCQNKHHLLVIDFGLVTGHDVYIFLCIILMCGSYAFVCKNFSVGLDFLLAFIGRPLSYKHPRKYLILYLLPAAIFACAFQSSTSSDTLKMLDFPTFDQFRESGFKFLTPNYKQILAFSNAFPEAQRKKIETITGPRETMFFEVTGKMRRWKFYDSWMNIVKAATKLRLFITSILKPELLRAVKSDVFYVEDDILCKVFHLSNRCPVPLEFIFRSWSYMSLRFKQVFSRFVESGIYNGVRRLFYQAQGKQLVSLKIRAANAIIQPSPLGRYSAVSDATKTMFDLPFDIETDCFCNIVTSNTTDVMESFHTSHQTDFVLTYTLFNIYLLNFAFNEEDEFEENPLTLKQGYARFTSRFQNNGCILFLLLTPTLSETLNAIQQSGYGTSEYVLFLIPHLSSDTENEIINGFNGDLLLLADETLPFHADVLFHQPKKYRKLFCLFCPQKLNDVKLGADISLSQLKLFSRKLKGNGNGQTFVFPEPLGSSPKYKQNKCLAPLTKTSKQNFRYSTSILCSASEIFILGSLQPILNVTLTMDSNSVDSNVQDWFLNVRQEGITFLSPNAYYLKVRGSIIPTEGYTFDVMVCQNKGHLLGFDFELVTSHDALIFLCIILTCVSYAFVYKNLYKGLDFLLAFIGKPFGYKHPRKFLLLYLIPAAIFTWCFQSFVSSDTLKLLDFPTYDQFRDSGFKFVAPNYKQLLGLSKTLSKDTQEKIASLTGPAETMFFPVVGNMTRWKFYENWNNIINSAVNFRLFITGLLKPELFQALDTDVFYVKDEILCKIFHLSKRSPLSLEFVFRSWSYMSFRFKQVFGKFVESGIYNGVRRLFYASKRKKLAGLKIRPANAIIQPKPLGRHSAVGNSTTYRTIFQFPADSLEGSIVSHTIYDSWRLNFGFELYFDDNDSKLLTLKEGYLRFLLRYRSICTLFYITDPTFEEAVDTIIQSGFSTSEDVLFIISSLFSENSNEIRNGFTSNLLFDTSAAPFHADVLLYQSEPTSALSIFCLFCPKKLNQISEQVELPLTPSFSFIKLVSKSLKSNGYGNSLAFSVPLGASRETEQACLRLSKDGTFHFGMTITCPVSELFVLASIQPILNLSIVLDVKNIPSYQREWFLNVRQEGLIFWTPNVFLSTRGSIVSGGWTKFDVMVCLNKNALLVFDFKFSSRVDSYTRICALGIFLVYSFLYKNVSKAIDLVYALLGKSFSYKHPRKCVALYLIAATIVTCVYHSNISSESLKLVDFPSFEHFQKIGYKFFTPAYKSILLLFKGQPEPTRQKLEKVFGKSENAFLEVTGELQDWKFYDNWNNLIRTAAKYKLFLASFLRPELFSAIRNDLIYFGDDTLCKVFHLSDQSPLSLTYRFRSWSYLSGRFHQVFTNLIESGIYGGIKKLFFASKRKNMKDMNMRAVAGVLAPNSVALKSVIGVVCLCHCLLGLIILAWLTFPWVICKSIGALEKIIALIVLVTRTFLNLVLKLFQLMQIEIRKLLTRKFIWPHKITVND
ncbi:unnamed protein product [Orchesella dallaii]|uniref:Uncharacterized protein n=1 Tax=Orchesella dallaii TaxID=48710 RepID=A0ABP1RGJ3_9HEXA